MPRRRTLFGQSVDRSIFVAYFLGGIVPLLGFALLADRVIPSLADRAEQWALGATIAGTGLLSLASFLALRHIVTSTLEKMDDDNHRLATLIGFARELSSAPHAHVVAESTAGWAIRVAHGEAAWLFVRHDLDKPFECWASRGDLAASWLEANGEEWLEYVDHAARDGEGLVVQASTDTDLSLVVAPLGGDALPEGALVVASRARPFRTSEIDALATLAGLGGVALANVESDDVQRNFYSHMTELVVAALDTHIQYRRGHASRVAETAHLVGRAMGLDERALHDLHFAALLHDVGMLRIPPEHQKDPKHFRKHTLVGHRMLSRIRAWEGAAPIVLQHHERIDGAGYPDGAVGDDICLGARILAVCDTWDAMRCDDWNRAALTPEAALAELEANAGTQFDPDVVRAFRGLVEQDEI